MNPRHQHQRVAKVWAAACGALLAAVVALAGVATPSAGTYTDTTSSDVNDLQAADQFTCTALPVTLRAVADTTVVAAGGLNAGSSTVLEAGRSTGTDTDWRRALVRFDLPPVPPLCMLGTATLRLYAQSSATGRPIDVRRASAAWTEASATWTAASGAGTAVTGTSALGWRTWAVIEHAAVMQSGTNYGFVVRDQSEVGPKLAIQGYSSREGPIPPELELTYVNIPAPPTGLTGAPSGTQVELQWVDDADGEIGYRIERSPAGAATWAEVAVVGANTTRWLDTGAAAETSYDYRIRSSWHGGTSGYSTTTTVTAGLCSTANTTTAAVADAQVRQNEPSTNLGTSATNFGLRAAGDYAWQSLVQLTVPAVPLGCALDSAALRLYTTAGTTGRTIQVQRVTAPWSETAVTWSTMPATTSVDEASAASVASGWQQWTVTAQVLATYTAGNNGFLVRDSVGTASPLQQQDLRPREAASEQPQLVVTFRRQ